MNKCVRRKFLGRLGKRILWILGCTLGGIAAFGGIIAILLLINRDNWLNNIMDIIAPYCAVGVLVLVSIGGIVAAKDWCKQTARECRWECENEARDANPRR